MTITLQDVVLLLGLSCADWAIGVADIPETWRQDFLQMFELVVLNDRAPVPAQGFASLHELTTTLLRQYIVHTSISLFIMFS
jgi:hypothetical protein